MSVLKWKYKFCVRFEFTYYSQQIVNAGQKYNW